MAKKKTKKSVSKKADLPGTSFGTKGKKGKRAKKGITTQEFSQGYCVCK